MHPFKTILLPTDFSEHSRAAASLAGSLASASSGRIILVHVGESPAAALTGPLGPASAAHVALPQDMQPQLDQFPIPTASAQVRVERRLEQGNAAEVVLRVAQEVQPDLIVLGSHGRTGLRRLLMGSVAETVLRKASCPVLIVKAGPE